MNVDAGKLNKRIEILSCSDARDSAGYPASNALTLVRSCWAQFSRQSGKEVTQANGDYGAVTARFLIRFARGIDRHHVIRYKNRLYDIIYINDYGDSHEYIELVAELITTGGTT